MSGIPSHRRVIQIRARSGHYAHTATSRTIEAKLAEAQEQIRQQDEWRTGPAIAKIASLEAKLAEAQERVRQLTIADALNDDLRAKHVARIASLEAKVAELEAEANGLREGWRQGVLQANAHISKMEDRIAELEQDRDRLDWLDSLSSPFNWTMRRRESMPGWALHHTRAGTGEWDRAGSSTHSTAREAIDSAMEQLAAEEPAARGRKG